MIKQFLEVGKVVGIHGVRGEIKVQPWCNDSAFLCSLKHLYWQEGKEMIPLEASRPHKNIVLLKIKGIDNPEQAQTLRNKVVYLNRDDVTLAQGEFFIQDLEGLTVYDADNGTEYGTLTQVFSTGANDVYEITDHGKHYLIPAIKDVIIETNPKEGTMAIRPIKGIFDHED